MRELMECDNFVFIRDFPPGHFYSPLPDLREVRQRGAEIESCDNDLPALALRKTEQICLAEGLGCFFNEMPFPDHASNGFRYFLDNPFFGFGDGIVLYSFLRHFRPKRIVEVGSGFSSAAMLDVRDRFFEEPLALTFIDPYPERLKSLLTPADANCCQVVVAPVQQVVMRIFRDLEENDFLFIDSSHVGKTQSDVLHLLFRVLPALQKGVLVHFHDIMWPFEYPRCWLEEGRAWNEAYFLRAFLQFNSVFEVVYFNSYMALCHAEVVERTMPSALKKPSRKETVGNSSLWLRKIA